jgi:sugar/nucleoside kinase (ribokinase family)
MNLRYNKVVGIGGIGIGMLFCTNDNTTLGRNESRLAELSEAKDYCKLHIVFNYTAILLAPGAAVYPVGYVGNDANGLALINEIQQTGMDTSFVAIDKALPTMISICLQYPSKETFNFTASNSACNLVTPEFTESCLDRIGIDSSSIVAAIPEVQVQSRISLIRYGKKKGAFCVLSVPESEAQDFKASGIFSDCDLLSVNVHEALALAPGDDNEKQTTQRLYDYLKVLNPKIMLLVTCGKLGAYSVYKDRMEFIPSFPANVINTTGAGDAFLGGTMAGLAMGMSFQKGIDDIKFGDSPISSAVELGTCCAGMAIETVDTIAKHVNTGSIKEKISHFGWEREKWFLS